MSQVFDLDLLVPEDIEIKIGGVTYNIPGHPSTDLTIKFMGLDHKRAQSKKQQEAVEFMIDMVTLILSQDDSQEVSKDLVKKFSPSQLARIVEIFTDAVKKIEQDPNS